MDNAGRKQAFGKFWIFLAIAACVAVAVALFEWNWLRAPLSSYLSERLGRHVGIDGDFHVELSANPRLVADSVVVANASWSAEPVMARVERVSFRLDPSSVWHPPLALTEVMLVRPQVVLERNADGRANWEFDGVSAETPPRIDGLAIEDGVMRYRNPATATDVTLEVASAAPVESGAAPVSFSGSGRLRDSPFTIEGTGASLLALENGDRPYRLDVRARAGDTRAHFDGTVVPERVDNVVGSLTVEGRDMSQLYPMVPVPVPWTPPYRLSGSLEHTSAVWYFRDFTGKVGDSDLAGNFSLDPRKPRPLVNADVVSTRLDYKDLGGFVGLPPGEQARSARTAAQEREAAKRAQSGRALPDKPYDLGRLRAVDAKVHFRGQRFVATDLPLDNMTAGLDLQDGVLKLQPLDFGVAGGQVASTLVLDARGQTIKTHGDVTVQNVELKQILPAVKPPTGSAGKVGGRARFVATGNSVAQMLATSDGEAALISRGGDASALAIVLANLDLARAVPLLLKGDESAPIRCVVADLAAENGRILAKSLVMDTKAEKILGEGTVDFAAERLDLKLNAQSKRASLVALRGPILIDGSFKSPKVHPAAGPVAARTGASVALGVLVPPAALIPLIDLGGAEDADCDALMQEASQNVETRKAAMRLASAR